MIDSYESRRMWREMLNGLSGTLIKLIGVLAAVAVVVSAIENLIRSH